MANYGTTLHLIASKLGLHVEDNFNVLSKAAEFERLLQMNFTANSNISDSSKIVICLDLAAAFFGVNLDVKSAIKYSGLKPSHYTNSKKVVENLLELNSDKLTVSVLCASLQCSGVQELSQRILDGYRKKAHVEIDLNLPQYVCVAVHQACRISKVKVPKSKIVDRSRLKPAQWSKLDAEWSKFVDENFSAAKKKTRQSKNTKDEIEEMEVECSKTEDDQTSEPQMEPFDDWKRRILDNAYKVLRERELKGDANMNDLNKQSGIEKDNNKRSNIEKDHSKRSNIEKDHSKRSNIEKDHSKRSNIEKDHSKRSNIEKYHSKWSNIEKDHSKRSNIEKDHSKRSDIEKDNNKRSDIDEDSKKSEIDNKLSMTPRRSPRKTPQKFELYKSPSKFKGVKLLFPSNF